MYDFVRVARGAKLLPDRHVTGGYARLAASRSRGTLFKREKVIRMESTCNSDPTFFSQRNLFLICRKAVVFSNKSNLFNISRIENYRSSEELIMLAFAFGQDGGVTSMIQHFLDVVDRADVAKEEPVSRAGGVVEGAGPVGLNTATVAGAACHLYPALSHGAGPSTTRA
jgi:hypothetical protein